MSFQLFKPVKTFDDISLQSETVDHVLPIAMKCERCNHDITEIITFYVYCIKEKDAVKEEHYCKKCLTSYKGADGGSLTYMDALVSGITPLYECRIKR